MPSVNGMHIPEWSGRARADALAKVKADGRRSERPCVICEQPIAYDLEYPHPQSCSVQHVRSRKAYPQLTWDPTNWAPAHLDCNQSAGTREQRGLGLTSEDY